MDESAAIEADLIAKHDQFFSKNKTLEDISNYTNVSAVEDKSVTIIGHTTEARNTVGNQTALQIAESLAKRYNENKKTLTELFLVACESGTKSTKSGFFGGSTESTSFAQQLADEMYKLGFDNINVYSVKPPEGADAIRVTIDKNGLSTGAVRAVAYMNPATTNYEDNKSTNKKIKPPSKPDKKIIMTAEKTHQETFKAVVDSKHIPSQKKESHSLTLDETRHEEYLEKLLAKNGILCRLFYAVFGAPNITNLLAHQLRLIKKDEREVLNELNELKMDTKSEIDQKTGIINNAIDAVKKTLGNSGSNMHWQSLAAYLALDPNAEIKKRKEAWKKLMRQTTNNAEPNFPEVMEKVKNLHKKIIDNETRRKDIKDQLSDIIDRYIIKNTSSPTHKSKCSVMTAIKTYLTDPNEENWNKVTQKAQDSPGWDKGFFSKVRDIKEQTEIFHDEINKNNP
jgi:hypothetical protein